MTIENRASVAMHRVRTGLSAQARPAAEHALTLALETMFSTGDSRSFLATSELDRYVGAEGSKNASRVIANLIRCGALEDITGTEDGEAFRGLFEPGRIWRNTRVVRLPLVGVEGQSDQAGTVVLIEGQSQSTPGVQVEGQIVLPITTTYVGSSCITSNSSRDVREYVSKMEPRSRVWKGNGLGSQAARAYGVVGSSPNPVNAKHVAAELNIGSKGAKDILRNLGKHELIRRTPDDTGWTLGNVTPATHDPDACPECSKHPNPVHEPSRDEKVRERRSQPRLEPSVIESVRCSTCHEWECQADHTPIPAPVDTRPILAHRSDGTPVHDLTGITELVYVVQPWNGTAHQLDPRTGQGTGKTFKPNHPDYPNGLRRIKA